MKIREVNPAFKQFEAVEEDFSKESVESSRRFIVSLISADEEWLKFMKEKFPNLKELIVYCIKNLLCYDLKIKPDCIKVEYENEDNESVGSKALMSFGRAGRFSRKQGIFGYVNIYPIMQKQEDIYLFILSLLHEFKHIYQEVARQRGEWVAPNVNMNVKNQNPIDSTWLYLRYCANVCEFDADLYSAKMFKKWLKEGEAKRFLSKKEYNKRIGYVNKKRAQAITVFALGNFNKYSTGVMLVPYLLPKYIGDKFSYRVPRSGSFDVADENNIINERLGYRTVESAQKYLRKSRRNCTLSTYQKLRIIDSMLVVFANKHKIPPKYFGLIRGTSGKDDGFNFNDARDTGESDNFGYIKLKEQVLNAYDGVEFFDKMVEYFVKLEQDALFKLALKDWNQRSGQSSIGNENSSN